MAKKDIYTNLKSSSRGFADAMKDGFASVTVMNAYVFDYVAADIKDKTVYEIATALRAKKNDALCFLDTLKIANITEEGPTKTVTGGQYTNPLVKFGKTARCEMQDALGRADALEALGGMLVEYDATSNAIIGVHAGVDFPSAKTILGETFIIDRESGAQVKADIVIYQFLPDGITNWNQDAEGDAVVFDENGDLLVTTIKVGIRKESTTTEGSYTYELVDHDEFYGIADPAYVYETE